MDQPGFKSGEGRIVLGAWLRSEEGVSANRQEGGVGCDRTNHNIYRALTVFKTKF